MSTRRERLQWASGDLRAEVIAVPPFRSRHLEREMDRVYWEPLKAELVALRRAQLR